MEVKVARQRIQRRWGEGKGVLNRFIGLQAATIIFVSHSVGPLCRGVRLRTEHLQPEHDGRVFRELSPLPFPESFETPLLAFFREFSRKETRKQENGVDPGSTTRSIRPPVRRDIHPRKSTPPPRSGINLGEEKGGESSMDADSRQIFIVSDTPPDFSEPSDTDSPAEIIYWRGRPREGRKAERGREGFVIEFRRNADIRRRISRMRRQYKSKTARN